MSNRPIPTENPGRLLSAYVAKWTPRPEPSEALRALDIPCGRGRHTLYLASLGYEVVAIDNDESQIAQLERNLAVHRRMIVRTILYDANDPLPLEGNSFDLVVTTHFVSGQLLDQLPGILKVGGQLIYKTYNAQGGNWQGLPKPGAVRQRLQPNFDILDYQERLVGPLDNPTVVVRTAARLR